MINKQKRKTYPVRENLHVFMSIGCPIEGCAAFHVDEDGKHICDACGMDITNEFFNILEALQKTLGV